MHFVLHHIKKHIMSGCSAISDAELYYLVKVVTARAFLCKYLFFPFLLADNLEVGVGRNIVAPCKYPSSPKIFHLKIWHP